MLRHEAATICPPPPPFTLPHLCLCVRVSPCLELAELEEKLHEAVEARERAIADRQHAQSELDTVTANLAKLLHLEKTLPVKDSSIKVSYAFHDQCSRPTPWRLIHFLTTAPQGSRVPHRSPDSQAR